jgi:hypothetical protein
MKLFSKFLLVIGLCFAVQQTWAQMSFTVKFYVTDGVSSDSLIAGFDSLATFGFDSAMGDIELPPKPPSGVFDTRFLSPRTSTTGFGEGKKIDMREAVSNIQSDTFMIYFQKSSEGGNITLTWSPQDIGNAGPGDIRWEVRDAITGSLLYVILNDVPSVTVNPATYDKLKIIRRDGAHFRTATMEDLALAVDAKGKQKGVKQKGIASHWKFTFTNTSGQVANKLVIKFGQIVTDLVSYSPFTSAEGVGTKEITLTGTTINNNGVVTVEGYGDKGKPNKAKGTFYGTGDAKLKPAATGAAVFNLVLLPMPNWINVIEDLYSQNTFGSNGVVVGLSSSVKSVIHPKAKDVYAKTLYSKGTLHDGDAKCLDFFEGGSKEITKVQKGLPAAKHNNKLLAEQLTLKINLALYSADKVDNTYDLGDLIYLGGPAEVTNKKVSEIAAAIDSVLSCSGDTNSTMTFDDWYEVASTINGAFADDIDTVSWYGKLVLTAPISIADNGNDALFVRDVNLTGKTRNPGRYVEYSNIPQKFELLQNYPNPFNPTTTIEFTLPEDANVTIAVYNMLGQKVATLAEHEEFTEGNNEVSFDASELASGVYFYRITVNSLETGKQIFSSVKKMMLVK